MSSDDLLTHILDAHGGLDPWRRTTALSARLAIGGPFWAARGHGADFDLRVTLATQYEHMEITYPDHTSTFDVNPERLTIGAPDGTVLETRDDPRASYPPFDPETTAWDRIQLAYFHTTSNWNYLTTPFVFTYDGVEVHEIDLWQENGETWRRLAVTFPPTIPNHNPDQVFYFGQDFLLRRLDYSPDVTSNPPVAHYVYDYREFDGFQFPTRRLVRLHDGEGNADMDFVPITVDVVELSVQ
jgi:hypothetical protein